MIVDTDPTSRRAPAVSSPAKQRILETADALFYSVGIHTVGIDRLIKESKVTKATFYKHYRAKDNLILEYVKHRHDTDRAEVEAIARMRPVPPMRCAPCSTACWRRSRAPDSAAARSSTPRRSSQNRGTRCACS